MIGMRLLEQKITRYDPNNPQLRYVFSRLFSQTLFDRQGQFQAVLCSDVHEARRDMRDWRMVAILFMAAFLLLCSLGKR